MLESRVHQAPAWCARCADMCVMIVTCSEITVQLQVILQTNSNSGDGPWMVLFPFDLKEDVFELLSFIVGCKYTHCYIMTAVCCHC